LVQFFDESRRPAPRAADAGRIPPHNVEAEESLLGAMMLSRDAITAAIEQHIDARNFYKPAHGHIYEACFDLHERGEPVDPITVAEELRRKSLLDAIGGRATLLRIQAATPASANASHYAHIVSDLALMRRLIGVAGDIAEMGYTGIDDVSTTIDQAESMVFEVAEHRISDSLTSLFPALEATMDQLEQLYDRDSHLVGTPTGYRDVDEILLGLQDSNLIIVAARPGQGKTSFALGAALHCALEARKPVLFFSMEMPHLDLTKRLLASEARIDGRALQTGRIAENEWPKLNQAVGRLAEAPFFIDDNAHCTVMEMRAKARRTRQRYGDLGLIVVDYLQLMSSSKRAESRQVEVSELSRGLKILARELEVPVMCLAQLNRQVEYRNDKRPMLADLRESGCLTANTRVTRADTNEEVTLGALVESGERDIPVWTLDERMKLVPGLMTHAFASGIKDTYALRFASGRSVEASANHPFLTIDGWRPVDQLRIGDRLATARDGSELDGVVANSNVDVVPLEVWQYIRTKVMPELGVSGRELAGRIGMSYCGSTLYKSSIGRERMRRLAAALPDRYLADLAVSDVFWDELVAIEPLGPQPVFDATVLATHNFLANGIVAHNSIEQDADVVMFIYRDEYYNSESEQRGTAEIIVAKHRSGPTGVARLAFLDKYTKFANMARE
jgi:replicative DNA helicase